MTYVEYLIYMTVIGENVEVFKSVCLLFAGVTVFLLGMKMMGDGLEKGAGKSVKKIFARIGDNRFVGIGIGAGATALVQSSSATTVVVVGFVNAGVMTLFQAAAIIMGANIGTTVTSFLGVIAELPVASAFMGCGLISVLVYMFSPNKKAKNVCEIITGFSIVFAGMNLMGSAFKGSEGLNNLFTDLFISLSGNPVGPLLLILIGAIFTGIIQSSSATTVMVVGLAGSGVIPVDAALFIVMGANIGTCVTALLSSIGTSVNAKRAAFIHMIFNVIGVLIFIPIIWPLRDQVTSLLNNMFAGNYAVQVAIFHLFFNVLTTIILLAFIKQLCWLATKVIQGKKGEEFEEPKLYFINEKPSGETDGIDLVMKEITNMAELARKNMGTALRATFVPDISQKNKITNTERKINFINKGICSYLIQLSKMPLDEGDIKIARSFHQVASDIERVGDYALGFLNEANEMIDEKIQFSSTAISGLEDMHMRISDLFAKSLEVFVTNDDTRLSEIVALEKEIDECKHTLSSEHVERLNAGTCSVEGGVHYYDVISGLERIADHLTNVAFSVKNSQRTQYKQLEQISRQKTEKRLNKEKIYW